VNSISWPRDENQSALKAISRSAQSAGIADLTVLARTIRWTRVTAGFSVGVWPKTTRRRDDSRFRQVADGRPSRSPQGDIVMDRNCDPRRRDARPLCDERESRPSPCADSSDVRWPINDKSIDKARVQPALMLRQLAFAMRISRALYAAAQLGIADLLAGGPMTTNQLALAAGVDAQSLTCLRVPTCGL
jgi:hypothetical protein